MPEYVIHIGPPKVGSKYLQTSFAARSVALQAAGVYYPVTDFTPKREVWHRGLCERLRAGPDPELERIFAGYNDGDHSHIAFSFEGLFGLHDEALQYLKLLVGNNPTRIVYYCRRLAERIPSLWVQNVKEGFSETFPSMYARALTDLMVAPDLNNRLVWERFARVFGRDSLTLVSFDNLREAKVDLVEHFARTFLALETLPPPDRPNSIDRNVSPDVHRTEILRAMNAVYKNENGVRSDIVRRKFLTRKEDAQFEALKLAMQDHLQTIAIDERRGLFELVHQETMQFKDRLLNPTEAGDFYMRKTAPFAFVRQDYLLSRANLDQVFELYRAVLAA